MDTPLEALTKAMKLLESWVTSNEGKAVRANLGDASIEIFSARDGGYRREFLFTQDGWAEDFYPVTQPSRKGSEITHQADPLRLIEWLMEEGECKTPADAIEYVKAKLGVEMRLDST